MSSLSAPELTEKLTESQAQLWFIRKSLEKVRELVYENEATDIDDPLNLNAAIEDCDKVIQVTVEAINSLKTLITLQA